MSTAVSLEEALELALKLAPKERLQLIERVASSIERDIDAAPSAAGQTEEHWGRNLLRLLDKLGPVEMLYPEIEDPVEWVKHLRAEERRRRLGDWGDDIHSDETE
ncbi:MAG: hypothetical protein KJ065_11910 [Anaerolineae bacterium]|nr:hypothetical protein [Anaerolineae bacterium]